MKKYLKLNGDDVILSVGETGLSERIVKGVRLIERKTAPGSFGAVLAFRGKISKHEGVRPLRREVKLKSL